MSAGVGSAAVTTAPAGAARITVGRWADVAALGVTLAGVGHVLAALDHQAHDPRFTVFFLVVGVAQLVVGPGLRRGGRAAVVSGTLAATVGLLLVYLVSRTVALDLGPHSDRPQDPDVLGTVVVICEVLAVAALPVLLPPRLRRVAVNAVLAVGVTVWMSWFFGLIG